MSTYRWNKINVFKKKGHFILFILAKIITVDTPTSRTEKRIVSSPNSMYEIEEKTE